MADCANAAPTLRPASRSDLPAIVRLLSDDVLGGGRERAQGAVDPRYEAAFEAIQSDPNQAFLVAERDGQMVGCLQLSFIPGLSRLGAWRGQIESVRVKQDCRGRGVGSEMIRLAIAECRERGCKLVQLTSDKQRTDAIRFYERLGFEASHEGMKLPL